VAGAGDGREDCVPVWDREESGSGHAEEFSPVCAGTTIRSRSWEERDGGLYGLRAGRNSGEPSQIVWRRATVLAQRINSALSLSRVRETGVSGEVEEVICGGVKVSVSARRREYSASGRSG